jgi:hypothetical protein
MDRRQYAEVVQFFNAARNYYGELGDELVADECGFAIALARRVLNDMDRTQKKRIDGAKELSAEFDGDAPNSSQEIGINAA